MEWLKKIPVLGSLAGDGLKSSEGVGVAAVIALAGLVVNALIAKPDSYPLALGLVGLGLIAVGVAVYANARSRVKEVAAKEAA